MTYPINYLVLLCHDDYFTKHSILQLVIVISWPTS